MLTQLSSVSVRMVCFRRRCTTLVLLLRHLGVLSFAETAAGKLPLHTFYVVDVFNIGSHKLTACLHGVFGVLLLFERLRKPRLHTLGNLLLQRPNES